MLTDPVIDWRHATHGSPSTGGHLCALRGDVQRLAERGTRGHASEISGGDGMMRGSSAVCAGQLRCYGCLFWVGVWPNGWR